MKVVYDSGHSKAVVDSAGRRVRIDKGMTGTSGGEIIEISAKPLMQGGSVVTIDAKRKVSVSVDSNPKKPATEKNYGRVRIARGTQGRAIRSRAVGKHDLQELSTRRLSWARFQFLNISISFPIQ